MTSPSRNAPCPCGSGRKYKRCCGRGVGVGAEPSAVDDGSTLSFAGSSAAARAEVRRADAVKTRDRHLSSELLRFARRRFGEDWMETAMAAYVGDAAEIDEAELDLIVPWALFHAPAPSGDIPIGRMALDDRRGFAVDPDTALLVIEQLDTWLGLWAVQRVEPGVGMEMTDILTRETRFVHEKSASRGLVVGDMLLARVVDSDGISFVGGVFPHPLGPSDAEHLAKQIRRTCGVRTRPVDRQFLRRPQLQQSIIDGWRRTVAARRLPPTLTNTDGDPLSVTTDRFDIVGARDAVVARLHSFAGATREDAGGDEVVFIVLSDESTVIARVIVARDMLRVETNSLRRADRMRKELAAHLGEEVRFRLRDEVGAEALMARALDAEGGGRKARRTKPSEDDPELTILTQQVREQYMQEWMDQPVPALAGLTPRAAAAKSAASRRSLDVLLKDFEHAEARLPAAERVDIGRIRRELLAE